MILTDKEISELVKKQNIIEKYSEKNLQAVSYDLTASNIIQIFNKIQSTIDLKTTKNIKLSTREMTIDYGYRLMPSEYILIKTKEKINMPENLSGHIRPRTTFSRLGLVLSDQHINPTFSGHLYLGMLNVTPNVIEIFPDLIIGQVVFEKIYGDITPELLYKNKTNAKYQNESDFILSDISKEISPETKAQFEKLLKELSGN